MALDFEALKKKLQEKESSGGGDISFYRPVTGRNEIRILPAKDGGNDFFAEAGTRWNVGPDNKKVFVPVPMDEPCPIREFVDVLKESDDPDDKALAKKMRYSTRYLFNVINTALDPNDENYGKVQIYEAPATVFKAVLKYLVDPDYSDLIDPENGYNIVVEKTGAGLKTEYSVRPRKESSPIPIPDWKEKMVDIKRYSTPKSYEDRLAILQGQATGSGSGQNTGDVVDNITKSVRNQEEEVNPWANAKTAEGESVTKSEPAPTPEPVEEKPTDTGDSVRDEIAALLNRGK